MSLSNIVLFLFVCVFVCLCCALQHCTIYLCGTKNDLIEGDRSLRQIDYHDAQDFAEGNYSLTVIDLPSLLLILLVLLLYLYMEQ